jgi:GH24 family phage-related lysozyme (muramidase)
MSIPKQAVDLIIDFEGLDQPWRRPGGDSGITIGYGYDLGFEENFEKDWDGVLTAEEIDILKPAIGLRGNAAAARQKQFDAVTINSQQARAVFLDKTLPHYESEAALAFTGIEKLPDIVRGALVSLVYNRGTAMEGPRRTEMRGIRAAIG